MKETKKQSYASALRQVVPGKSIGLPNASKGGILGICLRGIHQAKCEIPANRLKSDFESMRSVLKHLAVESKGTRSNRFGQEHEAVILRRKLTDNRDDRRDLRIRNLELERKIEITWTVTKVEGEKNK